MSNEIKKGTVWVNRFGRELKIYRVSVKGGWAHVGSNHKWSKPTKWPLEIVKESIAEGAK